ncbi:MAG: c-type cytochrome [Pseudomonadota bacterium]
MMRTLLAAACAALLYACQPAPATTTATQQVEAAPTWAYPINPPGTQPTPDDGAKLTLTGSRQSYTRTQLRDLFNAPDWHPDQHPPAPDVVVHGRAPDVRACGFCHLPTGDGRPENARISGLSHDYIVAQMAAFRAGERGEPIEGRGPHRTMVQIGAAANAAEVEAAARYFSALPAHAYIRVVESDTAPKTHIAGWTMALDEAGGTEPLGQRIVEFPDDFERFEMRDPQTHYTAYVPVGSIARGRALAETRACASCHGAGLKGAGDIPGLAGRSPSYLVRQLYDFQTGARSGAAAAPMRNLVSGLSDADRIALAAYIATLTP